MRKSNYSQEFRESTIKFCIDNSDRSISSIARDLGVTTVNGNYCTAGIKK